MLRKIFVTIVATVPYFITVAQTESPTEEKKSTTTISGSADVYYKYNFNKTKASDITSFTQAHNSFELGMASVKLEHKTSKVTMVADLGFGKRAKDFSYNDEGITAAIKQLFISYAPVDWLKFTMGSWATHVGYELVDPYLNRNYSMSYMFTNGPFFHTGLRADIVKGKHGFMLGLANPTDYKTAPDGKMNKKVVLAQYSFAESDHFKAYLNFVGGQMPDTSKSMQYDLVLTSKVTDKFSLGFNGTITRVKTKELAKFSDSKSWWGSALYINLDPTPAFGLTLREEYFSDRKQLKMFSAIPDGGKIFATTLSANIKIHSLLLIPEFRVDNASKAIFMDDRGIMKKSNGSLLLAAVYQF
jgi:hypothetical protein